MLSNRLIVLAVLAVLVVYGAIEAYPLVSGPYLALTSPRSDEATTDPVTVAGVAYRTIALTINGAPVIPDQNGTFSTQLAFPAGGSILELTAHDRFGRSITLTRTIVVR